MRAVWWVAATHGHATCLATHPLSSRQSASQWSILGGVDVRLAHHLRLRVGELAYSKIYLSDRTLTALNASAGFVYRIN